MKLLIVFEPGIQLLKRINKHGHYTLVFMLDIVLGLLLFTGAMCIMTEMYVVCGCCVGLLAYTLVSVFVYERQIEAEQALYDKLAKGNINEI